MDELVFRFLLQSNENSFSKEDISLQLRSHEDYPSLKAITDTLDYFGVDNVAANIPKDGLPQLPKLFLALIEKEGATELVLVTQKKQFLFIRTITNKKENLSVEDFSKIWTGTIIAIEQEENEVSTSFKKFVIFQKSILYISVLVVGILLMTLNTIAEVVYALLTVVGLLLSYLVTKESVGLKDDFTAKVCGAFSSKAESCSTVITSKQGNIGKGFGLGDASIIYFGSLFFTITFLGVYTNVLFVVSIGSLLVVGYSIYLQGVQLKQWCSLCLLISVVLISQFGMLFFTFSSWDFSFNHILKMSAITFALSVLWYQVKPLIKRNEELFTVKKEYLKFKRNALFFNTALREGINNTLKHVPKEAQVYFGSREASIQITAYTNPLCGYCVDAFELYDKLLLQYPESIGVQFVFNTPADQENPSTQIAKRILEEYSKDSKSAFIILKDWFANRDVDQWLGKYGSPNDMLLMDDQILQIHRDLAKQNDIQYTPETLLGNQKFPRKYYEYEDLFLFIETLKQQTTLHKEIVV
ncbi:vitamin K epoxide reductase family protein [Dokdonia sp.]|uniref:vitamin K epoxide reductase family protein n=1 Tax=Dokdonia sp. TaxID=2024995 RepID=UPI0032639BE1